MAAPAAEALRSESITLDGLRLRVLQAGAPGGRPPVVLLHGGGVDSAALSWAPTLARLAAAGRWALTPELPGYGESSRPVRGAYTQDEMLALLPRVFAALGLERFALGGISMGGGLALGYALAHPRAVERLALVDSYGLQRRAPWHWLSRLMVFTPGLMQWSYRLTATSRTATRWALSSIYHDRRNMREDVVDLAYEEARQPHAGRAFHHFQRSELAGGGLRTNYLDRLGAIHAPVLLIHGRQDSLVPLRWAEEAARRLPNARLVIIEHSGHWPQREQPATFHQALEAFLAEDVGA